MVGGRLHEGVEVGIEILAVHALVMGAGNEVPHVADDVVGEEGLAVFVPVEAPWVGGAVGDDFENFARGMVAPDGAVEPVRQPAIGRAGTVGPAG
jgi:hypothetical protein